MIVTSRIAVRIVLVITLAVILQVSFFSYTPLFGTIPDVVGVVIVSLGLLGGAVVGAVCGFATGLLLDSVLLQTLGVSSIVLLSIGYLAGRYREGFEIYSPLVPPLLAAGLVILGASMFSALALMLGVEAQVSLLVLREILLKGLIAFLLAVPLYPLIRRIVRPALIDDTSPRRVIAPVRARGRRRRRRGSGRRLTGAVPARRARGEAV